MVLFKKQITNELYGGKNKPAGFSTPALVRGPWADLNINLRREENAGRRIGEEEHCIASKVTVVG